jgi:hypothetical protein
MPHHPPKPDDPELDLRRHAEMLSCLVADYPSSGLLVFKGYEADPQTGEERVSTVAIEESSIVNGVMHIRTSSRKIPGQIVTAAETFEDHAPHHLYMPLAIMDHELPTAREIFSEADIVGVLGLVAHFEGISDYDERLPLEPDYVLACGPEVQAWYLFNGPALVAQTKPVAVALQEQAECEPTTADLACSRWIAGNFRYSPQGAGRVQVIKPWDGSSRTRLVDLQDALGMATGTPPREADDWPRPLGFAAYHGLARKVVEGMLPWSEADPAALLVHFLLAFGNAVGRGPHAKVEADRHAGNLFAAFVGTTGAGRKGTAAANIRELYARAPQLGSSTA